MRLVSALVGVGLLLAGCSKEEPPERLALAEALEQMAPMTVIVTKQALPDVLNNWHGVGLMAVKDTGERTLTVSEKVLKEGDAKGRRLLTYAAEDGNLALAVELRRLGVDVNERGRQQTTALQTAVAAKQPLFVEWLLKEGAEVDAADEEGWTPLCYAVQANNAWLVDRLARAGANVNPRLSDTLTPLMFAAWHGKLSALEALLKVGAEVDAVDRTGATALIHAAAEGRLKSCEALLKAGANPNVATTKERYTALFLVAEVKIEPLCKLLLRFGADPDLKGYEGKSVREYATEKGWKDVLEWLSAKR